MDHPAAVIEKAQRLEKLLQRVAQGEPLAQVCAELGLAVDAERLAKLQAKYEVGGCTWEALIDGRYGHPQKAHSALREWLHERKRQDEELTAPHLVDEVKTRFKVELSAGHINYLLRKVELTRPPVAHAAGQPSKPSLNSPRSPANPWTTRGFFSWKPRSRRWVSPRRWKAVWKRPASRIGIPTRGHRCGWC